MFSGAATSNDPEVNDASWTVRTTKNTVAGTIVITAARAAVIGKGLILVKLETTVTDIKNRDDSMCVNDARPMRAKADKHRGLATDFTLERRTRAERNRVSASRFA
jgi:hypothetical protein